MLIETPEGQLIEVPDEPSLNPEDQPGGYYLPEGAEVSARDANGNPIAYTYKGETYYPPGSQAYKQGFRTESERIQDGGERQVGLSQGESVPEGTILITDPSGKPLRRLTPNEVSKDPGYVGEQARLGNVRYPVKDFVGREKVLTEENYTKLSEAKTDSERLAISKKLNLVPDNWTLDDYTGAKAEREAKKQAAEAFVSQQEAARFERLNVKLPDGQYIAKSDLAKLKESDPEGYKVLTGKGLDAYDKYIADYNNKVAQNNAAYDKQQRALKLTAPYTGGDKVNVLAFLRQYGDSGEKALKDLGYDEKDIKQWRQQAKDPRYLYAEFLDKVKEKRSDILNHLTKDEIKMVGTDINLYAYADGKARAQVLKTYQPAQQQMIQGSTFAAVENIAIPYVETGANWKYMTPQEKAVAITFETATVLATIYGPRIIGKVTEPLWKPFTAGGQTARLAAKAGQAAERVAAAQTELAKFTSAADLKLNQVPMAMRAQEVKVAEAASRKADLAFIQKFEKLDAVSQKDLKTFETKAKLPGFRQVVTDVRKSANGLDDAWKATKTKQSRLYTNPKTATQLESNVRHQFRLAEVQAAQGRLQDALARAGSYLEPRYKGTNVPQAPEFKGFRVDVGKVGKLDTSAGGLSGGGKPISPQIGGKGKTQVQVVTAQDVGMSEQEFSRFLKERLKNDKLTPEQFKLRERAAAVKFTPIYEPIPKEAIKPAKLSEIPKIKAEPVSKPLPRPSTTQPKTKQATQTQQEYQQERGRMTPEQAARYQEDTGKQLDVRSTPIQQALIKTGQFTRVTPAEWQTVKEAINEGVQAHQQALTQGATAAQAKTAAQNAVKNALQSKTATQTKMQAKQQEKLQQKERLITREILKTPVEIPPIKPKSPIRFPLPGGSDKQARAAILEANGAIGWKQGQVGGKDRYDVIINPYQSNEDYVMVLGAPPRGAAIATGAKSAYRTAKVLYGKAPKRAFSVDSGFQDVKVDTDGKKVSLTFTPDPKGLTRGDIQIGRRQPRISGSRPRISGNRPRIGR